MKIEININKKHLYLIIGLVVVFSALIVVLATNNRQSHPADEVMVTIDKVEKTLQEAINNGELVTLGEENTQTIYGDWDGGGGFGGKYEQAICPDGYVMVGVGVYSPHEGGYLRIVCRKLK